MYLDGVVTNTELNVCVITTILLLPSMVFALLLYSHWYDRFCTLCIFTCCFASNAGWGWKAAFRTVP